MRLGWNDGMRCSLCVLILLALSATVSAFPHSKRDENQKYVFAHHMIGNTAPYTDQDWAEDIALASASGIDGFALNVGSDAFEPDQVGRAYAAAAKSKKPFKMFISLDMTVLPCAGPQDAAKLREFVTKNANSPAQFKYSNKVFVSTFAGENCAFGQGSAAQGWKSQFVDQMSGANAVFFVPNFFVDPSQFSTFANCMQGQFNWNAAWPITVTTDSFRSLMQKTGATVGRLVRTNYSPLTTQIGGVVQGVTGSLDSDRRYINAIGNKLYMASVSPWFFTHYPKNSKLDKNFVYLSDLLYPSRWQSILNARNQIPMVEILTWNDYGESSYIGPIKGLQPEGTTWVDGYDHQAFLDLTKYFITAYKTGAYPNVQEDKIYLWARPHTKSATATADSVGKPTNADVFEDAMFAVVLASAPAQVTLSTKSVNETVNVGAGLTQLSLPLNAGDTMSASLSRNDRVVVQLAPSNFTFAGTTTTYNFNAFAAMSGSKNNANNG